VHALSSEGRRIVICDYNALLLSITGLLRMSGYCVFQAYNAAAARELCQELPNIELLILNTTGTGTDSPTVVRQVREQRPGLPVLHSGRAKVDGMPADVPTLDESFTAEQLLEAVKELLAARRIELRGGVTEHVRTTEEAGESIDPAVLSGRQ
jgi:two-component system cell cycle sensor histidine kinase/response regulator CckA